MRKLYKGGNYSRAETIWGNTVFNFLQFSWPPVHETLQNSDTSIFFNFHDPGYMKIHKIQTIWFSSIFMTPGTLNPKKSNTAIFFNFHDSGYMKIYKFRQFDFLQFSWSRVQENPQKSDASTFMCMKINKNQTLWFSSIFIIPGTWKFTKIKRFDFLQLSWSRWTFFPMVFFPTVL